jgi:hypothetical protein
MTNLRGNAPIGWREDDGPEIGNGTVKLEGNVVKLNAGFFDADDAATDFHATFGVAEQERLPDVEMGFQLEEATMSINDLGVTCLLDLVALFIFGQNNHRHA